MLKSDLEAERIILVGRMPYAKLRGDLKATVLLCCMLYVIMYAGRPPQVPLGEWPPRYYQPIYSLS